MMNNLMNSSACGEKHLNFIKIDKSDLINHRYL